MIIRRTILELKLNEVPKRDLVMHLGTKSLHELISRRVSSQQIPKLIPRVRIVQIELFTQQLVTTTITAAAITTATSSRCSRIQLLPSELVIQVEILHMLKCVILE